MIKARETARRPNPSTLRIVLRIEDELHERARRAMMMFAAEK